MQPVIPGYCLHVLIQRSTTVCAVDCCGVQEPSSIEKVAEIDEHIGVAMSGLTADARTLIDHGRVETQQHRFTYNEPMPLESVTQVMPLAPELCWAGC